MKRNKRKKTPRGRTIIKKLQGNTVLLPGGGRYKVGEKVRFSGQGITPIKRKGKVGKVGYSIDDVSDLMGYKPEGVEVGHGVGFGVGFEVGDWKTYTYDPTACVMGHTHVQAKPSAWSAWIGLLRQYARELADALRWFFLLPLRALPDVAGAPAPVVPAAEPGTPADVAPAPADATPADVLPAIVSPSPFPELDPRKVSAWAAGKDLTKPKRKRKPRQD
jgi:hypothetical protein